jgi:hypothetical protein
MAAFNNRLYLAPAGEGTTWNLTRAPIIWQTADPRRGAEVACQPGFGDAGNGGVFELEVFDDHLYAGTFNHWQGFQVWKTKANGEPPHRWTKVIGEGALRGPLNEAVVSMCVFNGALYVGSGIQNGGYDRTFRTGPGAAELIRIHPDGTWDLIIGTPRITSRGLKVPLGGMGPGFDNFFNGYIWRMVVHDGWLYVGTFNWSVFLPYAQRHNMPPCFQRELARQGVENIVGHEGGFDLWRSRDGVEWTPVTRTGFGNPHNYGIRTMASTPYGLVVGTANPFGPEVTIRHGAGWTCASNSRGGAEVWLGSQAASGQTGH